DKMVEVGDGQRQDEIGEMSRAVAVFKDNALRVDRLQAEQEEAKAQSAMEQRRQMNLMADSFESGVQAIVQTVASAATEMHSTAGALRSTAERANM
ncbi:MAG: methyl-accepting chemotaxis protein, partial [Rhodospirillaceae bacterium]|nr:methyl-accepting chemotaxis protein [Rhodospirillaceae bacterium]